MTTLSFVKSVACPPNNQTTMSDTIEDMEAGAAVLEAERDRLEVRNNQWRDGYHIDRHKNRHKIAEMSDEYLKNVIDFFPHHDSRPLKEELARR